MPIYEFHCENCGNDFEKLVFSSKDKTVVCPGCGAKKIKRLLSITRAIGGGINNCAPGPSKGFS